MKPRTARFTSHLLTAGIGALALGIAGNALAADNSHAKLIRFQIGQGVPADGSVVNGSSAKLTRAEGVVWIRVNTTQLPPGAYTNWWVIFNNPDECVDGCDGTDLGIPAVGGGVFFASGGVVNSNGVGHFRAHLEEGELPEDFDSAGDRILIPTPLAAGGAQNAEIHFIVRYHGPASADSFLLEKQTNTHSGGCIATGAPGFPPDPLVADRIFECYDPQAGVLPLP